MILSLKNPFFALLAGFILMISVQTLAISSRASAQDDVGRVRTSCDLDQASFLGLPTWYKYLEGEEDPTRPGNCTPIIDNAEDGLPIALAALDGLLRLSGMVAVIMIFWASFKFLTSQGNGEAAAGARKTAINAMIGLVIIIIATSLVSFVGNRLIDTAMVQPGANYEITIPEKVQA